VRVAAVQHDVAWEDPPATMAKVRPLVAEAVEAGARLVVLTEMFSTGFSMASERVAEPVDGPSTAFLVEEAAQHGCWVCGSVPERQPGGGHPFNQFVLAGPAGEVHRYAKLHPFTYAGEDEHYAAGTERVTVTVEGVRISPFVCYDLRFGDELWGVAGATDLYVVVANWPAKRRLHWQVLLQARAIENQAYVVGVNRVGDDGNGIAYAGDSRIIDPLGEIVAAAPDGEQAVVVADVDPERVSEVRERFPFLADRR
jgi:predicted amidohydrolase